jgi:acyl-coenzyme A synthetase/AMP-(fatty) acid ligase
MKRSWIQRPIEAPAPSTRDRDGYFWVIWRIDDVANLSGDRLSTAVVESATSPEAMVAEAAVIG